VDWHRTFSEEFLACGRLQGGFASDPGKSLLPGAPLGVFAVATRTQDKGNSTVTVEGQVGYSPAGSGCTASPRSAAEGDLKSAADFAKAGKTEAFAVAGATEMRCPCMSPESSTDIGLILQ